MAASIRATQREMKRAAVRRQSGRSVACHRRRAGALERAKREAAKAGPGDEFMVPANKEG